MTVSIFIAANSTDTTKITHITIVLLQSKQEKNRILQLFEDLMKYKRSGEKLEEEEARDKFMDDKGYRFYQKVLRFSPLVLLIETNKKLK